MFLIQLDLYLEALSVNTTECRQVASNTKVKVKAPKVKIIAGSPL